MKYKLKFTITFIILLMVVTSIYSQSIPEDSLYLGQTPPGNTPKIFAPGLLASPGDWAGGRIAISPDGKEIYYTDVTNGWGLPNTSVRIKYYKFSNNRWNGPYLLFENYYHPTLSLDGSTLFLAIGTDVWYSHKNDTVWGTPALYLSGDLYYFQVTKSGNIYVGNTNSIGGCGDYDVCQLDTIGHRISIKSLGPPINTSNNDAEFFVAKDESFIITSKNESAKNRDLYLSYRKSDNTWTSPKALITSLSDSLAFRWGPYVTPDNKYLFYTRGTSSKTTYTYWVRFDKLLDSLRYTDFAPYVKRPIESQTATKGILFNFIVPDSVFFDDDGNNTLTYSAALSNGKSLPGWLSFNSATRTFSGNPNKIETDSIKVTATDTAGASVSTEFRITVANPSIDYFGQSPPGDSAVVFAPGIISLTDRLENSLAFSPDGNECFISVWGANYSSAKIYWTKRVGNEWTPQVEAPFSVGHFASRPFFSLDGNKLYFHYANYSGPDPYNIWMVQRTSNGWSEPIHLPSPINSNYRDGSYSETADGTVYFTSNRPGGYDNKGDIWRTRKVPGQPLQVENLGNIVNSSAWDADSYVSPDGSFLIFTSERPGGYGSSDIYITYKKDDGDWTQPVNMERNGNGINIKNTASVGPSISPDGKFLFFSHWARTPTGETADIYWISTKVIDDIKKEIFNSKITK
ncbi:MAG: putative Ig domain-containing protein [Ignavibacteriaceae bacterium]